MTIDFREFGILLSVGINVFSTERKYKYGKDGKIIARKGGIRRYIQSEIPDLYKITDRQAFYDYAAKNRIYLEELVKQHPDMNVLCPASVNTLRFMTYNDRGTPILFESFRDGEICGHTADFIEVRVKSDIPRHAEFLDVRLLSTNGNVCVGTLIE